MLSVDTPKSMFLNFASRFEEQRVGMISTLISFSTIGFIVTTSMAIIGISILKYHNKKNGQE